MEKSENRFSDVKIQNINAIRARKHVKAVNIFFTLESQRYFLYAYLLDGKWIVEDVLFYQNDKGEPNMPCKILTEQKEAIFQELISHPDIRLEWIYE